MSQTVKEAEPATETMTVRARISAAFFATVAALAALVATAGPAAAGDGAAHISPELTPVRVDGARAARAQAAYDEVLVRRDAATQARLAAEAELVSLAERDSTLTAEIAAQTEARKLAAVQLVEARRDVQRVAVGEYVMSATYDDLSRVVDVASSVRIGTTQELGDAIQDDRAAVQARARDDVDRASRAVDSADDERDSIRGRAVEVTAARDQAAADEVVLNEDLAAHQRDLEAVRATSRVAGADFSLVALDAYWRAAAGQSSCGIAWWAIAGVSRVEGHHGTYGGATLGPDGRVSQAIIGVQLDGTNTTRFMADTDAGALDGDAAFDRAVGPMQFIPSTWARWARDGDGDGVRDPQNIYDAAAAAAAYLCHGRRLTDDAGLRAGYYSYNQSPAYVERVLGFAHGYAALALPPRPL